MDPWFVVSVLLGIGLAVAIIAAARHDRDLDRTRGELVRQRRDDDARRRDEDRARREVDDLVRGLDSGIVRLDEGLRISWANAAAHALLGRAANTLAGRSVIEAFLDPRVEGLARTALAAGSATGIDLQPADADSRALAIRARRTTSGGVWLVIDDVSELRRLQRIRAEFIDNLSHELRTPLSTVSLLTETLATEADAPGLDIPPKMRDRIAKIEVETGHLVQMVNELLDLSRIEQGGTLDLVELDLGRLAAASAERLRLFAERQGVSLRVDAVPGLPIVRGDPARLGQVVVNLVHNAVKFSPDGGAVAVAARATDDEVVVSVEDHGLGIPRADQDRVFERFYKVDRSRLRAGAGGGTGLGLAIARHVVEQHGGRIWLESVEGSGSTFSFALPIAPRGSV